MRHLSNLVHRMARAERMKHESGMVALLPTEEASYDLMHYGQGALDPDDLHVTIRYLGLAAAWSETDQAKMVEAMAELSETLSVTAGTPWAVASINPRTENACCAYIVGGSALTRTYETIMDRINGLDTTAEMPVPHEPWVPHLTVGYGIRAETVDEKPTGTTIGFDRIRVAFAESHIDFKLNG